MESKYNHQSILFYVSAVLILTVLVGCASTTVSSQFSNQESESVRKLQATFLKNNPIVKSADDHNHFTVRMATAADMQGDQYNSALLFPVSGAVLIPVGMTFPPMYGSAIIMGGILLIPLGTFLYLHEKNVHTPINDAIITFSMTQSIANALSKYSMPSKTYSSSELNIEVRVDSYGLVEPQVCLNSITNLKIRKNGQIIHEESIRITDTNRTVDVPPPQCASYEKFADRQAELVKSLLNEYADITALIILKRIHRVQNQ